MNMKRTKTVTTLFIDTDTNQMYKLETYTPSDDSDVRWYKTAEGWVSEEVLASANVVPVTQ